MVLKRIIRQFLNQHFPENIIPTRKLDRKSTKIIENQSYFNYVPLFSRVRRAHLKLRKSRIYPLRHITDGVKHQYSGDQLNNQNDPFLKDIEHCITLKKSLDKSSIHYKTELCKDYFLDSITYNADKNPMSSNQWTGLDINRLTWRSRHFNVRKAQKPLYSLSQYKAALGKKGRRDRSSIYKSQLMERKKLGLLYGNLSKKEIYRTIQRAEKYRGVLRENILRVLESRLDVILYRVGFFKTIPSARQWIIHRKILVNRQVVTIAHYQVKAGDVVSVDPEQASVLINVIQSRLQNMKQFKSYPEQPDQEQPDQEQSDQEQPDQEQLDQEQSYQEQPDQKQPASFWPFIADRRALKKIFKFGIVNGLKKVIFRAAKKIIETSLTQFNFSRRWKKVRSYKIFLRRQRNRCRYPKRRRTFGWKKTNFCILHNHRKLTHSKENNKQKWRGKQKWGGKQKWAGKQKWGGKQKWEGKQKFKSSQNKYSQTFLKKIKRFSPSRGNHETKLAFCFKTIKQLQRMKLLGSLARKEYGIKLRDPLFTYKHLILLKNMAATPFPHHEKESWSSIDAKKPLHLEVSYKTLTAVYLYSPQKLFFPVNIDIDGVKNSYY